MRHQTRKARRRSNARSRSYVKNYQPCKLSVQDAVITCYIKPKSSSTISITGEHAQVRVNTAPAPVLPPPPVTPKTVLKTPVPPQPKPTVNPQATTTNKAPKPKWKRILGIGAAVLAAVGLGVGGYYITHNHKDAA
jgi:hypothetical protein